MNTPPASPKFLVVLGTRPEIIKLEPVITELKKSAPVVLCFTGQHALLAETAFASTKLDPEYALDLMTEQQSPPELLVRGLAVVSDIISAESPDWVLVQGDTTSSLIGALAGFYSGTKVAHVEAGLRTATLASPFPEEGHRRLISAVTTHHFAPNNRALQNLLREGISRTAITVTGNTGIDFLTQKLPFLGPPSRLGRSKDPKIVITLHRREKLIERVAAVARSLDSLLQKIPALQVLWVMHPNPKVKEAIQQHLAPHPRVRLSSALAYENLLVEMEDAALILTDSGGLQEEAPSLKVPVLIVREETERIELIEHNLGVLVGLDQTRIVSEVTRLLHDPIAYQNMTSTRNPFGDGKAAQRIAARLLNHTVEEFQA